MTFWQEKLLDMVAANRELALGWLEEPISPDSAGA